MDNERDWPRLSAEGYELLFTINDTGADVTPDGLADALEESFERITSGPCKGCGAVGDMRFGWCYQCATEAEAPDGQ